MEATIRIEEFKRDVARHLAEDQHDLEGARWMAAIDLVDEEPAWSISSMKGYLRLDVDYLQELAYLAYEVLKVVK